MAIKHVFARSPKALDAQSPAFVFYGVIRVQYRGRYDNAFQLLGRAQSLHNPAQHGLAAEI
jgi:hypothetical protein